MLCQHPLQDGDGDDAELLRKALSRITLLEKQLEERPSAASAGDAKSVKHPAGQKEIPEDEEKNEPPIITPDGQKVALQNMVM